MFAGGKCIAGRGMEHGARACHRLSNPAGCGVWRVACGRPLRCTARSCSKRLQAGLLARLLTCPPQPHARALTPVARGRRGAAPRGKRKRRPVLTEISLRNIWSGDDIYTGSSPVARAPTIPAALTLVSPNG
eukprot:COSAG01_NODE_2641_length_7322_cov_115.896456_8_plen_132_part_00